MASSVKINVQLDKDIKKESENLFEALGVNLNTAINVFLRQSLQRGGFPFEVTLNEPNKTTITALEESEKILKDKNVKRYSDVEEALKDLKA